MTCHTPLHLEVDLTAWWAIHRGSVVGELTEQSVEAAAVDQGDLPNPSVGTASAIARWFEVAALLRQRRLVDAESRLGAALGATPGPIANACLATPADSGADPSLSGARGRADPPHRPAHREDGRVRPIQLRKPTAGYWWDKEPRLTAAVYTDAAFAFSKSPAEEIQAAGATRAAGETGRIADAVE